MNLFWKKRNNKKENASSEVISRLQLRYKSFLGLLLENEHALDLMTELEDKYYKGQLISIPYLKSIIKNLSLSINNIIYDLKTLSGGKYHQLLESFEAMEKDVRGYVTGNRETIHTPTIIPMDQINIRFIDKVGSKMANLGELKNACRLNIPDGFGLTACAFTHFSEYNNLPEKIGAILSRAGNSHGPDLQEVEKNIKRLIAEVQIPSEIAEMIHKESAKLEKKYNRPILWAVRSSAIGEDLENSFAGQFSSILNVPTHKLLDTYKAVVGSKYNTRSILYQKVKSIRSEDVNMSVGFIEMVDAASSGVLYTTNPVRPEDHEMVVSAIWGLGQILVDGSVLADTYILRRIPDFAVMRQEIVPKEIVLNLKKEGGLERRQVPEGMKMSPCLTEDQLRSLWEAARVIEDHFKCPQDIEWCFDGHGKLVILQARPLHLNAAPLITAKNIKAPVISDKAQPVAAGVGSGKVFKLTDIHQVFAIPRNAVLVLKNSSPQYIGAFRKARAVVVEKGNLTDHMSSVVREFRVPCVVRVPDIFSILEDDQEITVDAVSGVIYSGIVEETIDAKAILKPVTVNIEQTESYRVLKEISNLIFPLNLTDPRAEGFKETACRTWHDVIRFSHEVALNEMFALKDKARLEKIENIHHVKTNLPLSVYVLNLFENAVKHPGRKEILPDDILCEPLKALWGGMNAPEMSWEGPARVASTAGLFSAIVRTPAVDTIIFDTKSFAVITPDYLNMNLSMGYHYIVLDTHLSEDPYLNHIALSFKGGAADIRKRKLRVLLVAGILKRAGFMVNTNKDFLKARIKAEEAWVIKKCLHIVGKMFCTTRLLDLSLEDEATVDKLIAGFYDNE